MTEISQTVQKQILVIGMISEFNVKNDFVSWIEHVSQYFIAKDVKNKKKVAILLTTIRKIFQ